MVWHSDESEVQGEGEPPVMEPGAPTTPSVEKVLQEDGGKQWFVVNTYSGYEGKVKTSLEMHIKASGMDSLFGRLLIPTEDVLELNSGKRRVTTRKFFPGYLL